MAALDSELLPQLLALLLPLPPMRPLLPLLVVALLPPALGVVWPVVVVLGANAAVIRPAIAPLPVLVVENPAWAEGMPIDGEGFTCRRYKKG